MDKTEGREIPLTQGKVALVDAEDYDELNKYKWYAHKHKRARAYYARRGVGSGKDKKSLAMHRVIMNAPNGIVVDHINGDGLDNRKSNMRLCTNKENCRNQVKGTGRKYTSQYKGVTYFRPTKKWKAEIVYNRETTCLGYFLIEKDAALAYDNKAKELYGEFANLNLKENTDG